MKATIFALVALAIGIGTGIGLTQQEFSHEAVPVDVAPEPPGAPARPRYGPKVKIINGERYDFGTMDRNAHGTHSFIVLNDGDAPLTLTTGQPSCSVCIKVFQVAKDVLQPGERTEVKIEWDVKTSDGEFEQSGPLNTNDKIRPSVHLSIHGHVLDTVRADRSDIHFHDLSPNETANAKSISTRSANPIYGSKNMNSRTRTTKSSSTSHSLLLPRMIWLAKKPQAA